MPDPACQSWFLGPGLGQMGEQKAKVFLRDGSEDTAQGKKGEKLLGKALCWDSTFLLTLCSMLSRADGAWEQSQEKAVGWE